MHSYKQLQLLLVFTVLFSVSQGCAQNKNIDESSLLGCWTNSYEESASSTNEIYRPCEYKKFPPSRFRFSMALSEGGVCQYFQLSPNDAHGMMDGTWTLDAANGTLTIFDGEGNTHTVLIVNSLEKDLLQLKKAE